MLSLWRLIRHGSFMCRGIAADPWQRRLAAGRATGRCCSTARGRRASPPSSRPRPAHRPVHAQAPRAARRPSLRQSSEIFRKVLDAYNALGRPVPASLRDAAAPGAGQRRRASSACPAARRPSAPSAASACSSSTRPPASPTTCTAPSGPCSPSAAAGSSPCRRRSASAAGSTRSGRRTAPGKTLQVTWRDCPAHHAPSSSPRRRRALGDQWVGQEYECAASPPWKAWSIPTSAAVSWTRPPPELAGRQVGGIDFGWRNPFAAVWGVLDRDDVLWIQGERYLAAKRPCTSTPPPCRAAVTWYADPAGRTEIEELRPRGPDRPGRHNDIRPGIAAVTARLRTGRLKVLRARLPQPASPRPAATATPRAAEQGIGGREAGGRAQPRPGRPALPDLPARCTLHRSPAQAAASDEELATLPREQEAAGDSANATAATYPDAR